jgi:hypothetical protein
MPPLVHPLAGMPFVFEKRVKACFQMVPWGHYKTMVEAEDIWLDENMGPCGLRMLSTRKMLNAKLANLTAVVVSTNSASLLVVFCYFLLAVGVFFLLRMSAYPRPDQQDSAIQGALATFGALWSLWFFWRKSYMEFFFDHFDTRHPLQNHRLATNFIGRSRVVINQLLTAVMYSKYVVGRVPFDPAIPNARPESQWTREWVDKQKLLGLLTKTQSTLRLASKHFHVEKKTGVLGTTFGWWRLTAQTDTCAMLDDVKWLHFVRASRSVAKLLLYLAFSASASVVAAWLATRCETNVDTPSTIINSGDPGCFDTRKFGVLALAGGGGAITVMTLVWLWGADAAVEMGLRSTPGLVVKCPIAYKRRQEILEQIQTRQLGYKPDTAQEAEISSWVDEPCCNVMGVAKRQRMALFYEQLVIDHTSECCWCTCCGAHDKFVVLLRDIEFVHTGIQGNLLILLSGAVAMVACFVVGYVFYEDDGQALDKFAKGLQVEQEFAMAGLAALVLSVAAYFCSRRCMVQIGVSPRGIDFEQLFWVRFRPKPTEDVETIIRLIQKQVRICGNSARRGASRPPRASLNPAAAQPRAPNQLENSLLATQTPAPAGHA